jgi:hypothetical protein
MYVSTKILRKPHPILYASMIPTPMSSHVGFSRRATVLHITSLLPFLPASAAVRSRVVSDLCAGKLVPEVCWDGSSQQEPTALKTAADVEKVIG